MINYNYYIKIVIRILFLLVSCIVFAFLFTIPNMWFSIFGMFLIIILQSFNLIRYFNKYNLEIIDFLASVKDYDANIPIEAGMNKFTNSPFNQYFNDIKQQIFEIKSKEIKQTIYLRNILENVEAGFIEISEDGVIQFMNPFAAKILGISQHESLHEFKKKVPGLFKAIHDITPGKVNLIQINANNEILKLSVKALRFKMDENIRKMIFFHDIKRELDENEIASWQKLIRVLSHEINNSVAPITSLTDSLAGYLSIETDKNMAKKYTDLDQESVDIVLEGINIIRDRGKGLIDFIDRYRNIIPKKPLEIGEIDINELFYQLKILFEETLVKEKIAIQIENPVNTRISADKVYLEQALINLVKNAIESFTDFEHDNKTISLNASKKETGEIIISVKDNGKGIPSELLEKVQIPFFTTKKNGNGIGLNLVRQIIHLHKGVLKINSIEHKGTEIKLIF